LGKRALEWVKADQTVVTLKNTRTVKTAELRPTPALMDLLPFLRAQPKVATEGETDREMDHAHLEAVARKIASMPDSDIMTAEPGR
jgi:hypothetical protein